MSTMAGRKQTLNQPDLLLVSMAPVDPHRSILLKFQSKVEMELQGL